MNQMRLALKNFIRFNNETPFRTFLIISVSAHLIVFGTYYISKAINSIHDDEIISSSDMPIDITVDIPPELIGGDSSPAKVEKDEWVEGSSKTDTEEKTNDVDTNKISGDGTDADGYLFSIKGDMPPRIILDFDPNRYYPAAAKEANIMHYTVTVLIQVNERGELISAKIASGDAPYGFNDAALEIVHKARFSPGYKAGERVKMVHYLPVDFVLN